MLESDAGIFGGELPVGFGVVGTLRTFRQSRNLTSAFGGKADTTSIT
jgi:hypothetical protein